MTGGVTRVPAAAVDGAPAGGGVGPRPILALAAVAAVTLIALHAVVGNGFLVIGFDDDAFILDNPYLHAFTLQNVWACVSRFYFHDYLPLPLLSYLVEFQFWHDLPPGYHLTNLVLHVLNASLVYLVAQRALGSPRAALFAALVFAVHPVQVEVVSVVAQRKTLLATAFLLGALLAYQRYGADQRRAYVVAVLLYVGACASKASVVPFPFLLLAYDAAFQPGRRRWLDKLPFLAVAVGATWLSLASKAGAAVVKAPQGGHYLATVLVMSRVFWEYVDALLLPLQLSPTYYYAPRAVFSTMNWLAAVTLLVAAAALIRWRARMPLTAFGVAWLGLSLLPVANIVPIAVLRADRYLYLPMVGFAIWAGAGCARLQAVPGRWRRAAWIAPYVAILLLATLGWQYTYVWRNDVTAWTRVVQRHPWNARANYLLALAYAQRQALDPARRLALRSAEIDPTYDQPHALLAEIYRRLGDGEAARRQAERAADLAVAPTAPASELAP